MRVGLIHYGLNRQTTGIGRYTTELAASLSSQGIAIHRLWAGTRPPDSSGESLRGAYLLPGLLTVGQIEIARLARQLGLDIVHDPTGAMPLLLTRSVRVVTIHDAIPYVYPADVGEEFELRAEIEGRINNQFETGASVLLGVPFQELVNLVNDVTGENIGDSFEGALITTIASSPAPLKPLVGDGQTTVTVVDPRVNRLLSGCGAVGIELAVLPALFGIALLLHPRRR